MTLQKQIDIYILNLIIPTIVDGYDRNLTNIIYEYKKEFEEVTRDLEKKEVYSKQQMGYKQ